MRPVTLYEKPPFPPYVCIYCGVGEPPRKWFIDPGMSLDFYFNPIHDGTPFICNECWANLKTLVERSINQYNVDHDAWDSPDRVLPTYRWKEQVKETVQPTPVGALPVPEVIDTKESLEDDGRESESDTSGVSETSSGVIPEFNFEPDRDDSSTESDDSVSESTTVSENDMDDESGIAAYSAIFGERPDSMG